MAKEKGRKCYF